ncbi:MAG: 1,4-alpha-glucan branching protein GlgB [Betaproteobacteria bacterium]
MSADLALPDDRRARLLAGRLHDPLGTLGLHRDGTAYVHRALLPHAARAWIAVGADWQPMQRDGETALFVWRGATPPPRPTRLRVDEDGALREFADPYGFAPTITDFELHLFGSGRLLQAWRCLGANPLTLDGIDGARFAVWAPNAERVSVVGDFNRWDGRAHPMQSRGGGGVWELFIPGVAPGALYKFELRNRDTGHVFVKADPYAQGFELRPATAAIVQGASRHQWRDADWLARRAQADWLHAPMHIYEVHAYSWMRHPDGRFYSYRELADRLVPYVTELGCTHIELMPITEHPLDLSWGYQTTGYFAPSSRGGDPDGLRELIDRCHQAGIGVLLDWVPGHFPSDAWALAHYDGTALYEHADPRSGRHPDWGTHIFNYGRAEVRSFLLASAHYWLEEFHFDGLRVDAVASMLYLDYSRAQGEWIPNRFGGRENLEAIDFLRSLNTMVHGDFPGALTIAEESTAWPQVSRPVDAGGLGFSMKWNMGWMHDTLEYMRLDPVHRRYHHRLLTFGQLYAYTENFVLPLSHDEVVHGKGSLVAKMPGDDWQRFANLRLLFAYQMTYPGKKLNFMGSEFAHGPEWHERGELEWHQAARDQHAGVRRLYRDLAHLYRDTPALHQQDFEAGGFRWIEPDDADHSLLSYIRYGRDGSFAVVALNLTPVPRVVALGVPAAGRYVESINTDSRHYGGSDVGNAGGVEASAPGAYGLPATLRVELPPLAAVVFSRA